MVNILEHDSAPSELIRSEEVFLGIIPYVEIEIGARVVLFNRFEIGCRVLIAAKFLRNDDIFGGKIALETESLDFVALPHRATVGYEREGVFRVKIIESERGVARERDRGLVIAVDFNQLVDFGIGALLFVLSDLVLAWDKFVSPVEYRSFLVLVPYYAGQFLIWIRACIDNARRNRA